MWKLDEDIEVKEVKSSDFMPMIQKYLDEFFDNKSQVLRLHELLTDNEKNKLRELDKNKGEPFTNYLVVYKNEELIGWHYGFQESAFKYYMSNSAILPKFRNKGLYTKLLSKVIDQVSKMGFQEIYSKHFPTNNAILIPKLKLGFSISGIEIDDQFGTLVTLKYLTNESRKKIVEYRSGYSKPDEKIKKLLRL